ncbi:hypothetical protein Q5H92_11275 [Hymenobacter sp. M29]|uniref:DUF4369 domain-containing protein n=1 Tax=Hymenobacter mellowenesis TaxID=3063995 RepID=A0ABT9AAS4_9BACT|nr:hypothetical protein [Hymenobacter sp. M29]MDO7846941.1 hypothetical protein [Hymenobacter sp. M29]
MTRFLLLVAVLLAFGPAQGQAFLTQDYHFIGRGLGTTTLRQSHDTLYLFRGYPAGFVGKPYSSSQLKRAGQHYKIIAASRSGKFDVLKVEQLDTLALTSEPYPETRYSLVILNHVDDNAVGYLSQRLGSTKAAIDTANMSANALRTGFYFTYFSSAYMKKLAGLKKISTKEQAQDVFEEIKSGSLKGVIDRYERTKPQDLYASGLTSELINLACVKKGYSPIGAQQAINALLK